MRNVYEVRLAIHNGSALVLHLVNRNTITIEPNHPNIEYIVSCLEKLNGSNTVMIDLTDEKVNPVMSVFKKMKSKFLEFFTSEDKKTEPIKFKESYGSRHAVEAPKLPKVSVRTSEGKVVENVQKIAHIAKTAIANGSTKGIENLIRRLSHLTPVQQQSLLSFLAISDLPITEEGNIIAFRHVRKIQADPPMYVDIFTGKVNQTAGTYVSMDRSMVDPNSRNHCSVGLHIASRGYLSSYGSSGSLFITIFKPEDVTVVPDDTARKIRVSGYMNVEEITDPTDKRNIVHTKLCYDDPGFSPQFVDLIGRLITMPCPEPTSTNHITRTKNTDFKVLGNSGTGASSSKGKKVKTISAKAFDGKAPPVPVSQLVKNTLAQDVRNAVILILDSAKKKRAYKDKLDELEALRKQKKRSYASFGVPQDQIDRLNDLLKK